MVRQKQEQQQVITDKKDQPVRNPNPQQAVNQENLLRTDEIIIQVRGENIPVRGENIPVKGENIPVKGESIQVKCQLDQKKKELMERISK